MICEKHVTLITNVAAQYSIDAEALSLPFSDDAECLLCAYTRDLQDFDPMVAVEAQASAFRGKP